MVDPACGTGVFVVETVEQMSAFLSFDELIKFVENNMFASRCKSFFGYCNEDKCFKYIVGDST